jgi:pilus assembly protein CpaE
VQSELSATLERIRAEINQNTLQQQKTGKLISIVGSIGGVGATMFAAQAAAMQAARDHEHGGEACLFDLDLQFGNVATYLGLAPKLTIIDLLEAGGRVDTALVRAVTAQADNGLCVVAAPGDIIPLESVSADQLYHVVDLAVREFDTVFVDLPGIWTNWSLSLTARSDIIVLMVEMNVASLRQAKRQIMLLASQGIGMESLIVVANRVQKKLFRTISFDDAERVLGHPISFSIGNDFPLVSAALDQGVTLDHIKSNSRVAKDILAILDGCEAKLARGR